MASEAIYEGCEGRGIEEYFECNPDMYEIIESEFMEYLVDVSVNEHTVHWCGHSEHALEEPYLEFESFFLTYNQRFYEHLAGAVGQGVQAIHPLK